MWSSGWSGNLDHRSHSRTDLTGGNSGTVTVNVDTTKVPQLAAEPTEPPSTECHSLPIVLQHLGSLSALTAASPNYDRSCFRPQKITA